MNLLLLLYSLTISTIVASLEYDCSPYSSSDYCVIENVNDNYLCQSSFPAQPSILLRSASLNYFSPLVAYRMEIVRKLNLEGGYIKKAYVKPTLEYLKITDCHLDTLEIDPSEEYELTELNVNSNSLAFLPAKLNQLKYLTDLDLSYNQLAHVDLASLGKLEHLIRLKLNNNLIKVVFATETISLPTLEVLNLAGNGMQAVYVSRWTVPALKELDVSNNQRQQISLVKDDLPSLDTFKIERNLWQCDWLQRVQRVFNQTEIANTECQITSPISSKVAKDQLRLKDSLKTMLFEVAGNKAYTSKIDELLNSVMCGMYD